MPRHTLAEKTSHFGRQHNLPVSNPTETATSSSMNGYPRVTMKGSSGIIWIPKLIPTTTPMLQSNPGFPGYSSITALLKMNCRRSLPVSIRHNREPTILRRPGRRSLTRSAGKSRFNFTGLPWVFPKNSRSSTPVWPGDSYPRPDELSNSFLISYQPLLP